MEAAVYNRRSHRDLPRDVECVVSFLFGPLVGPCSGPIHRHHTDPDDPDSRTVPACEGHHPSLHRAIRALDRRPKRRRCPHPPGSHRTRDAREICERNLNR